MKILVDSNILLRVANASDSQHRLAKDAVAKLLRRQDNLCMVPQAIYEFWVVATRPVSVNGLGFGVAHVQGEIVKLKQLFVLLKETDAFYPEWEALVSSHWVVGKNAHDTRYVAAMIVHGIAHLLTFNKRDFQRFTNITAMTPAEVMAMP